MRKSYALFHSDPPPPQEKKNKIKTKNNKKQKRMRLQQKLTQYDFVHNATYSTLDDSPNTAGFEKKMLAVMYMCMY